MERDHLLALLRTTGTGFLATVEQGHPRVRAVQLVEASPDQVLYYTHRHKPLCQQLQADPEVEVCFWSISERTQVRIHGRVELLDDDTARQELLDKAPRARQWIDKEGFQVLMPFRLRRGDCRVLYLDGSGREETCFSLDLNPTNTGT